MGQRNEFEQSDNEFEQTGGKSKKRYRPEEFVSELKQKLIVILSEKPNINTFKKLLVEIHKPKNWTDTDISVIGFAKKYRSIKDKQKGLPKSEVFPRKFKLSAIDGKDKIGDILTISGRKKIGRNDEWFFTNMKIKDQDSFETEVKKLFYSLIELQKQKVISLVFSYNSNQNGQPDYFIYKDLVEIELLARGPNNEDRNLKIIDYHQKVENIKNTSNDV